MSKIKLDFKYECKNSVITFNGLDNGVNKITVSIENFGEDVSLDNSIAVVAILKPSGKVYSQFGEVEGNKVVLNLEGASTDETGIYTAKLLLVNGDKRKITRSFKYEVEQENILSQILSDVVESSEYPMLTDMLSRLSTIENDEEQRQLNEAQRILNEDARLEAEALRVEAELTREHNDADREKAEAVRGTNENARLKAEKLRSSNEDARVEAELLRVGAETSRVEAEKQRNDNYNFMTEDEARRRSNEDARVEAEAERKKVEANRVAEESKRRTVETARVKAEDARVKAEDARVVAETNRVAAETNRVEAEKLRSSRYETLIGEAERSVQNFNSYTSNAKLEESERSDNEVKRVEAEKLRSSNESTRVSNEKARSKNEQLRVEKEATRNNVFDAKIVEVNNKVQEVNVAKDTIVADAKKAIDKINNDFNSLSASQQQDAEVILARDGEESLNARLARDLFIGDKSLKQEVIDLGGLKESQDMAYATDKGYLVCKETKNGTIKDLKISGKSLINLNNKNFATSGAGNKRLILDVKPNTDYTYIATKLDSTSWVCVMGEGVSSTLINYQSTSTRNVFKFNTSEFSKVIIYHRVRVENQWQDSTPLVEGWDKFLILEGDYTQSPPNGYFEGIASVGNEVDKIEVLSMGKNLCTSDIEIGGINSLGKPYVSNVDFRTKDYVKVYPTLGNVSASTNNSDFVVSMILEYDSNFNFISVKPIVNAQLSNNCMYVKLRGRHKTQETDITNMLEGVKCQIEINSAPTSFEDAKQDKKTILFKDADGSWKPAIELRGLAEVCDTIELHSDGKYYYHVRMAQSVLNENISIVSDYVQVDSNSCRIAIDMTVKGKYLGAHNIANVVADKAVATSHDGWANTDKSNVITINNDGGILLRVPKAFGETAQAIKESLRDNAINFIYELAEEKVFEVNPLFLEAFEGETMMSINSGVINALLEFKIASYITNLVLLNQQRISILEEQVMGMFKSVLSGDMRTLAETLYPQDFVFSDDEIMLLNKL